jgi:integrase
MEQIGRLFAALSIEFRPVAETLFFAGLRISEALSLRWKDIDFESNTLDVRGTKTKASAARIPLHPQLAQVLKAHRADAGRIGLQRIAADALVFPTASGKPQSRRNALRAIANAGCRIGLSVSAKANECEADEQPVGCHDLRHSLAANAFEIGLTDVEIARVLRHANVNVTRTTYAGITESGLAGLSTKLAGVGGGAA